MTVGDLPEGQQPNLGPFFNESAEDLNVSIRKLVAGLDTLGIRPYADNAPSWSWVMFCLDGIEKLQREVARVRADVAEDLRALLAELVDPAPCSHFDHHGHCQTHGATGPMCPHGRAQALLAETPAAPAESVVGAPPPPARTGDLT